MKTRPKIGAAKPKGDGRDYSRMVLAAFDQLQDEDEANRIVELNQRRREVEESAKKRF